MRSPLSLLCIAIALLLFESSCRKSTSEHHLSSDADLQTFFATVPDLPSPTLKVIDELKKYESNHAFVSGFTKVIGFPVWDKSEILFDQNSKISDTVVIVPFARKLTKNVSAFMVCHLKPDGITFKVFRGDMYKYYPISNEPGKLNRTMIAREIMRLDNIVFGYSEFVITDSTLFDYPTVALSKEGTRKVFLQRRSPDFNPDARDIYITGEYCWDEWMPNSGDLVGVAPDGSIEYGHYETQCESFAYWVSLPDGGGGGSSAPAPPPGTGGGGGSYTSTYVWNDSPCDPYSWQSPFSSCDDYGVVGWEPLPTQTDEEFTPDLPAIDPDAHWWDDTTMTFQHQELPSWNLVNSNYPKDAYGNDLPALDVYRLIGGPLLAARNASPTEYGNACAARVSRALNYSGVDIPYIPFQTFLGADNKYYFINADKLCGWMRKTFGTSNAIVLQRSQGGTDGSLFQGHLSGQHGIYLMLAVNQRVFGASGHATLYDGSDCVGGHCYFNATGGVQEIILFKLP